MSNENLRSSKNEINISEVKGDIIGVGVSGSGNIIGKNIQIYQSIDSAQVSYKIIKLNPADVMGSLQQLASYFNLNLYEKNQELIPFVPPSEYQKWKDSNLLLYGRSGCGKSRTVFEIIKENISKINQICVVSPRQKGTSNDITSISNLNNMIDENDMMIWDNFPDGVLRGEINVDHGLEILMSVSKVKHFIVSINPLKLELYKSHLWKLRRHMTIQEVTYDLELFQNLVMSYGKNISRFKSIYAQYVDLKLYDISKILANKEPTPLVVLQYYEKLFSIELSKLKNIDNGFAIQLARELPIPSEYYADQFLDISNERPQEAEFLYILKLCYDLGLETGIIRVDELQRDIFGSSSSYDPSISLSTWVYMDISDKHYFMYDVARNVVKYADHQMFKIMNYLNGEKFLSSIPHSSYYLFGQFIGENIIFLESDSPDHFLPKSLRRLFEDKDESKDFENGLGTGISKKLLSLQEDLTDKILKIAKKKGDFSYSLGHGLGFNILSADEISDTLITSSKKVEERTRISVNLQSKLLNNITENLEFGKGIGYGLGFNFLWLEKDFQQRIFNVIDKKSILEKFLGTWKDFAHSLGNGLGQNYVLLGEDLQSKVFSIAENREDFGHGIGFGLAEKFLLFDNNLQDKIFEEIKGKKHVAYGLGYGLGYNYVLHNDNTQRYILQIGLENEEFRKGLGQGFCNDFGSFSRDIMAKIESVYSCSYSWKSTGTRKIKYTKISLHPRIKVRPSASHVQNRIHGFLLYDNRNLDICMQYPIDWKVVEYENMVEFYAPKTKLSGKYKTRILVSCNNTLGSLNDYLDRTIGYYKSSRVDFCLDNSSTNAILADHPAYELVYTHAVKNITIKNIEVGTIINDKEYFIACSAKMEAFEGFLNIFSNMKATFNTLH